MAKRREEVPRTMASYQYVGKEITRLSIDGADCAFAPGRPVTVPIDDPGVQRLREQGLLIPYALRQPRRP